MKIIRSFIEKEVRAFFSTEGTLWVGITGIVVFGIIYTFLVVPLMILFSWIFKPCTWCVSKCKTAP